MITMSCAWQSSSLIHRVRDLATLVPDMVSVRIAAGNTISARPCCEMKSGGGKVTVCSREGEERKSCIARAKCTLLKSSDNSCGGPAEAARFAYNDAMVVCAAAHNLDERARSDIALLSQYFSSWIRLFAHIPLSYSKFPVSNLSLSFLSPSSLCVTPYKPNIQPNTENGFVGYVSLICNEYVF